MILLFGDQHRGGKGVTLLGDDDVLLGGFGSFIKRKARQTKNLAVQTALAPVKVVGAVTMGVARPVSHVGATVVRSVLNPVTHVAANVLRGAGSTAVKLAPVAGAGAAAYFSGPAGLASLFSPPASDGLPSGLPSGDGGVTGGLDTSGNQDSGSKTPYYIAGGVLLLGVGILMMSKKRKKRS